MPDLSGQSLGRYHILEKLGEGGMATVYKAYDTRLERDVAIKIIRRKAFPEEQLDRILKRFEREAKALARLTHTNIVSVIDYGEYEDAPYLVMEYLSGGTLKQRLGTPMPWQKAVRILLPIAQALEYAHEHSIIHRDIKPSNILLTEKGQPMLSDFGIAKILESEETQTLTGTGVGIGTPEYMAPEQWTGQTGPQSDLYSLGVVLYELVTGRKPYTADTPAAVMLKQVNDPLPRPRQFTPDLLDNVEKVIIKALAKKTENRYSSMEEFITALENLVSGQNRRKEPTFPWRKEKSEKSPELKHETPSVQKQVGDRSTLDAQLPSEVKPSEPVSQTAESGKTKFAPPETPPIIKQRRRKIKIRPAWIIALVGLVAVIAFAVSGMPQLPTHIVRTPTPSAKVVRMPTLTRSHTPTMILTHTPTLTRTLKSSPTPKIALTPTATFSPTMPTATPCEKFSGIWRDTTLHTNYHLDLTQSDCKVTGIMLNSGQIIPVSGEAKGNSLYLLINSDKYYYKCIPTKLWLQLLDQYNLFVSAEGTNCDSFAEYRRQP